MISQTLFNVLGPDYNIFKEDTAYKNAIALCVLQIGELTTKLSQELKESYADIPWIQIKALRNVVAHQYGKIDEESLWEKSEHFFQNVQNHTAFHISNLLFIRV